MQIDELDKLTKWFKTNVWELSDRKPDADNAGTIAFNDIDDDIESESSFYADDTPVSKNSHERATAFAAYDYDPRSDVAKREKLKDEQILFEHIVGLDR